MNVAWEVESGSGVVAQSKLMALFADVGEEDWTVTLLIWTPCQSLMMSENLLLTVMLWVKSGPDKDRSCRARAQHESIHGSPVLEPVGLVNTQGHHLDPNRFKCRITWPADDYPQVTCVYPCMPKAP